MSFIQQIHKQKLYKGAIVRVTHRSTTGANTKVLKAEAELEVGRTGKILNDTTIHHPGERRIQIEGCKFVYLPIEVELVIETTEEIKYTPQDKFKILYELFKL
jgi:hypothetical protein